MKNIQNNTLFPQLQRKMLKPAMGKYILILGTATRSLAALLRRKLLSSCIVPRILSKRIPRTRFTFFAYWWKALPCCIDRRRRPAMVTWSEKSLDPNLYCIELQRSGWHSFYRVDWFQSILQKISLTTSNFRVNDFPKWRTTDTLEGTCPHTAQMISCRQGLIGGW